MDKNNLSVLAISILFSVILFEVCGRIIPNDIGFQQSAYLTQYHPKMGFVLKPNLKNVDYKNSCARISNSAVNSFGMRGLENYSLSKDNNTLRIAVLGDSFIHAREVPNRQTMTSIAERLLSTHLQKTEVLNFGVNAYGTIQEYLLYEDRVKGLNPDIVVLSFFIHNDILNNSRDLTVGKFYLDKRPYFIKSGLDNNDTSTPKGETRPNNLLRHKARSLHLKLKGLSFTYFVFYKYAAIPVREKLNTLLSPPIDKNENQQAAKDALIYMSPINEHYERAWHDTEKAILLLRQAVESNGGEFVLMIVASIQQMDEELAMSYLKEKINNDFLKSLNLTYPLDRLKSFATTEDIPILVLKNGFTRYKNEFNLPYPYYYFRCDGHWNPLGHFLVANLLLKFLLNENLVHGDEDKINNLHAVLEANLHTTPLTVLGERAWSQIYDRGIYTGTPVIP